MTSNTNYFFDVLPVHPPPERLESLTSYSTRLAQANNIKVVSALAEVIDITGYSLRSLKDRPPISCKKMSERTACLDLQIMATTFFHLGRKFDQLTYLSTLAGFLRGCLGQYLRYCPLCLADNLYYSLTWRFSSVVGCDTHGCRFLDYCEHCGSPIPLFAFPSKIGTCPTCKGDIRLCRTQLLSAEEISRVHARTTDFTYLLSSHSCEEQNDILKKIGYRLAMLRRERCLAAQQVADDLGMSLHDVIKMEVGNIQLSVSLLNYQKYAEFLGIMLQDIFRYWTMKDEKTVVMPQEIHVFAPQAQRLKLQPYEDVVVEHVEAAITSLKASRGKVYSHDIVQQMHMPLEVLRQHPAVETMLKQVAAIAYITGNAQTTSHREEHA